MKTNRRMLAVAMSLLLVLPLVPQAVFSLNLNETADIQPNSWEEKTISILGASMSTYAGTSNGAAADTTNSTIRNNAKYYPSNVVNDVTLTDTWWMQAVNDLGLRLLVNNSWSGSSLLHERNGTVGAYVDRCVQLHDDTGDNAGEQPDIIAIQMGTNDFQYFKDTLGTADIDYETLISANGDGTYTYAEPTTSLQAAAIVLHKISVRYPNAEVYYLNISQRVDDTDDLIRSFNAELAKVVEHFGAHIVDIYGSAITMENFDTYIGDGRVHPNRLGMDVYTEAFKRSLLAHTRYTATTHTVSLELDGVSADYGDDKIVMDKDSYTLNLSTAAGNTLQVKVTMGGTDITADCYANGVISISAVTDDVIIHAASVRIPKNYTWTFDGADLASTGKVQNTLTKTLGTTTDGIFDKTAYALQNAVVLMHDQPWVVEWKCQGTFLNAGGSSGARLFTSDQVNAHYNARFIFKSNTKGLIAMGEKTATGSHNYGIALADHGIDWTAWHTYRLENRIAADGSNMVYLYVDGREIGALNHYYIGTKDQKTTSDWLSGKDFTFPYMGTDTHGFSNCSIEYIKVQEAGNSFTDKKVSILSHSASTYAGVSNDTNANSTIGKNDVYYTAGKHGVYLKDTWWQQAIDALDMQLLVNNSWSGSCIFQPRKGATSVCYLDRAVNLHNDRTGEEPDIIWVYIGGNDFAYYKDTFGKAADVDYDALITDNGDGTFTYATPTTTCEAYVITLHKIEHRYPNAQIWCMTSTARRETDYTGDNYPDAGQPTEYCAELHEIAAKFGFPVVDLEKAIPKEIELFDKYMGDKRAHPNALGMDQITNEVLSVMLGKQSQICHVTSNSAAVKEQAVLLGGSYTASVALEAGASLIVTMNGENVTDRCCNGGEINVSCVTGDITVEIRRAPKSFRWELSDNVFGSVTEGDFVENSLTIKQGSIENGIFTNVIATLAENIYLYCDQPWTIEWAVIGNWDATLLARSEKVAVKGSEFIFRSSTEYGLLAIGSHDGTKYNNYGIPTKELAIADLSARHVYRLENRVSEQGNMVWLYIDGVEIGPMNHHYIGSKQDTGNTSDWVCGRDFTFGCMGTTTRAINYCTLEYLEIHETSHVHTYTANTTAPTCTEQGYTTHTCMSCGDVYVDGYVDATGHSFGEWIVTKQPTCTQMGELQRLCGGCEHFETCAVAPTQHAYVSFITSPTCTEQGYTTHTCACGDTYVDSYTDATGHMPGDWLVDTEPQIGVTGVKHRICTVCEKLLAIETIPALPEQDTETEPEQGTTTETEPEQETTTETELETGTETESETESVTQTEVEPETVPDTAPTTEPDATITPDSAPETDSATSEENPSGCKSVVYLLPLIGLLAVGIAFKKRKNN